MVEAEEVFVLLFSDDALFSAEGEIREEPVFISNLFLMILGYHFSEGGLWIKMIYF